LIQDVQNIPDKYFLSPEQTAKLLYSSESPEPNTLLIKEATARGYKEAHPGDSVNLSYAAQNKKRGRVGKSIANTIDTSSQQGVVTPDGRTPVPKLRRLMPRECLRLQGFTDPQIDRLLADSSDTQAYKQAGNAVTVNVVHAIAERLKVVHESLTAAEQEVA
jgi:DNA (cytosine-5)-methyltransferase 1